MGDNAAAFFGGEMIFHSTGNYLTSRLVNSFTPSEIYASWGLPMLHKQIFMPLNYWLNLKADSGIIHE